MNPQDADRPVNYRRIGPFPPVRIGVVVEHQAYPFYPRVTQLLRGGEGERLGLHVGDVIMRVEDQDLHNVGPLDFEALIAGQRFPFMISVKHAYEARRFVTPWNRRRLQRRVLAVDNQVHRRLRYGLQQLYLQKKP